LIRGSLMPGPHSQSRKAVDRRKAHQTQARADRVPDLAVNEKTESLWQKREGAGLYGNGIRHRVRQRTG